VSTRTPASESRYDSRLDRLSNIPFTLLVHSSGAALTQLVRDGHIKQQIRHSLRCPVSCRTPPIYLVGNGTLEEIIDHRAAPDSEFRASNATLSVPLCELLTGSLGPPGNASETIIEIWKV
jgi:hypothetical protein